MKGSGIRHRIASRRSLAELDEGFRFQDSMYFAKNGIEVCWEIILPTDTIALSVIYNLFVIHRPIYSLSKTVQGQVPMLLFGYVTSSEQKNPAILNVTR